jgi:hypothetical protein
VDEFGSVEIKSCGIASLFFFDSDSIQNEIERSVFVKVVSDTADSVF